MNEPLVNVIERLEAGGFGPKRNGRGWTARCPGHGDARPSLSIDTGDDGRVLLRCFAGCDWQGIIGALGLKAGALFADNGQHRQNGRPRIVAAYDYVDEHGELLSQVVRYQPKDFRQRRPNDAGGWVWSLKGVRRVLYRLPAIVNAPAGTIIWIVEGEKDAARLADAGFVSTCCPGGAGKWARVDDTALEGRDVVIVPDADDKGRRHAQDVARRLRGRAASVRIIELSGCEA